MLHNQRAGAARDIPNARRALEDDGCSADDVLTDERAGATGNILLGQAEKSLTQEGDGQEYSAELAGVSCLFPQTENLSPRQKSSNYNAN